MPEDPSIVTADRHGALFFERETPGVPNMLLRYTCYHTTKKSENPTDFTGVTRK